MPHEQDKQLKEKLYKQEAAGILAWAVQGCLDWQREGLGEPPEVQGATEQYREEMDVAGRFLGECCVSAPTAKMKNKDLYAAYVGWCDENGETALTNKLFGKELEKRGHAIRKMNGGYPYRLGIRLKEPDEFNPELRLVRSQESAA
jgi:putative DNA primase/helicase